MSFGFPFERRLRRISPLDFPASLPLYILSTLDLQGWSVLNLPRAEGWTGPMLDVVLRPHLMKTGQWHGRGFAMVIAEDLYLSLEPLHRDVAIMGIVAHEAAHMLSYDVPTEIELTEAEAKNDWDAATIDVLQSVAERGSGCDHEHRLDSHGPQFIRCCAHLLHRATEALVPTSATLMVIDQETGWSAPSLYIEALGDEPARRINESIRSILRSEPPAEFARLAAEDEERLQSARTAHVR